MVGFVLESTTTTFRIMHGTWRPAVKYTHQNPFQAITHTICPWGVPRGRPAEHGVPPHFAPQEHTAGAAAVPGSALRLCDENSPGNQSASMSGAAVWVGVMTQNPPPSTSPGPIGCLHCPHLWGGFLYCVHATSEDPHAAVWRRLA